MILIEVIEFNDSFDCDIKGVVFSDVLQLSESYVVSVKNEGYEDLLRFVERVDSIKVLNLTIEDTLTLTDEFYKSQEVLYDQISFVDSFSLWDGLYDSLSFDSVFDAVVSFGFSDTVAFVDNFTVLYDRNLSTNETLVFAEGFSAFNNVFRAPEPVESATTSFVGIGSISLPNPKMGDSRTLILKRVNRESKDNTLIIRDVGFNQTRLIKAEWEYLKPTEAYGLQDFVKQNIGRPVVWTDHYGVSRNILFSNPNLEVSQIGRENYTLIVDMVIL